MFKTKADLDNLISKPKNIYFGSLYGIKADEAFTDKSPTAPVINVANIPNNQKGVGPNKWNKTGY